MSGSKKNLKSAFCREQRIAMVDFTSNEFPISVQANLLGLNRTSLYYKPKPPSDDDLFVKRKIDEIYMKHPEFGHRRIREWLKTYYGIKLNKKTVLRHMQQMGIEAIYPRQRTSTTDRANKIYPYLLKELDITHPNHVWSIDITYVPIRKSWLYLTAIIDWYSRYVIAWAIDDTLEIGFVLETCKTALTDICPIIMNSDQGSHFTSPKYTQLFLDVGTKISMDHRGRAYDNIFVERLWRTVKYENIYMLEYDTPKEARRGINDYLTYYNKERLHQSLGYLTPEYVYRNSIILPDKLKIKR